MVQDDQYRILEYLMNQSERVDILPLIKQFVDEGRHSKVWYGTQLNSMKSKHWISIDDTLIFSIPDHKSPFGEDYKVTAEIIPDGVEAYHKKKSHYEPTPIKSDSNSGVQIGSNNGQILIGSNNNQSFTRADHLPVETPAPNAKSKTITIKSTLTWFAKFIADSFWKILLAVIAGYILYYFGWKK